VLQLPDQGPHPGPVPVDQHTPEHLDRPPLPGEGIGGLRLGLKRSVASAVATGAVRGTRGRGRRRWAALACTVAALRWRGVPLRGHLPALRRYLRTGLLPGITLGRWRRHLST